MDITIHSSFLPQDDADAAITFYRDRLGLEVRADVERGGLHWITVGAPGQDSSIVLAPPAIMPGVTDEERRVITDMMAKGTYAMASFATDDLDTLFEKLQAADVDIVQEPTDQPWGVRDFAVRDPFGTLIRVNQR